MEPSDDHKIAIIGYSCKFPDANNPDELWANLLSGKDSVGLIPDERSYIPGNEKLVGGFLAQSLQTFDANFFNISPKRACYLDPQQRLFLESVWESLENAGIPPSSLKTTKTGVFVGVCADDYKLYWRENVTQQDFMHEYVGNTWSAFPGQIAYFLDIHGPAIAVETACSSSAAAIHMGCQALRRKECPIVIAGGVNFLLDRIQRFPDVMLSDSCKTFDERANGFAPAEGCGVVVLKRYKDALEQGDNILGIILGTALNHDGHTRSLGTPNSAAQEEAIRDALKDGDVSPSDVTFLEAHGTGTQGGDPCEIQAINSVFAGERKNGLVIGAIKPNIGHSLAASGVASLIKAIQSLNSGIVPKILHLRQPSSKLNLSMVPLILPTENINLETKDDLPLIAGLNSFGLSGTNVHLIIQAAPKQIVNPLSQGQVDTVMPSYHMVTISAKTETALESLSARYVELLMSPKMNELSLADFSLAVNTQRDHFTHRIAIVAKDKMEVLEQLISKDYTKGIAAIPATDAGKIVFLFTGQGSLYSAVGKNLYASSIIFQNAFQKCEEMVDGLLHMSLKKYLWEDEIGLEPSTALLAAPALFSIQYSLFQVWTAQFGVKPDIVLGHSIGEFAACVAAGILSFESAMGLICKRGQLVQKLEGGNMAAITAMPLDHIIKIISKFSESYAAGNDNWIEIAAVNSKTQIVISGTENTLSDFFKFAEGQVDGMKLLNTSHAFHSRAMDPVLNEFGEFCNSVVHNSPTCIYVSASEARIVNTSKEFSPQYWQNHFRNPVQFSKAINLVLQSYYCSSFVEIGPQPVLLKLASEAIAADDGGVNMNALLCPSLRRSNQDGWFTLLHSLAKLHVDGSVDKINWKSIGQVDSLRSRRIKLPNYPFQKKKYWLSAVKDKHRTTIAQNNLHSLLGCKTDLPRQPQIYFSNALETSTLSYFADHKVVGEVLLPGACFLEMALFSAQIASKGSNFYIEDFTIPNGLFLTKTPREVVTLVFPVEDGELMVEIFSRLQDSTNWRHHSASTINSKSDDIHLRDCKQHLFFDFKSALFDSSIISHSASGIYDAFTQSGIQMGPQFQSLKNIWQKGDEFIFKLDAPNEADNYFCHPIILDAMIQSFWYCNNDSMSQNTNCKVFLPVGIQKFFWWNGLLTIGEGECLHIRVLNEGGTKQHVLLYGSAGHLLAGMQGISIVETTEIALLQNAENQKMPANNTVKKNNSGKHPDFYIEEWVQVKTVTADRVPISLVPEILSEEFSTFLISMSQKGASLRQRCFEDLRFLNKLAYFYIVECFHSCGWRPKLGAIVAVNSIRALIAKPEQPIPFKSMVLYRFLLILEEEGILKMRLKRGILSEWEIAAFPPKGNAIKKFMAEHQTVGSDGADFKLLHHCGSNLVKIFCAQQSPLEVLFSEGAMNATQHYSQSPYVVQDSKDLAKVIEFIASKSEGGGIFRILEIGAGTGATTAHILNKLENIGRPYEYTFTDVANSLLTDSKRKFEDLGDKIDYQTLNIDCDPKDQGFCPNSFDLIIAANVLHATKDLAVSLGHVKELIVDQGFFLIVELLQPSRLFDISYGLLDSWWSFTDSRAEDMYPLVNFEKWSHLLAEAGFTNAHTLTHSRAEYSSGVIIARADSNALLKRPLQISSIDTKKNMWVIFNNNYDRVAHKLKTKLEDVGKFVVVVKPDLSNSAILSNVVHPLLYSSFENVLKTLRNGHGLSTPRVEGVVFLSHSNLHSHDTDALTEKVELMPIALMHLLKAVVLSTELKKVLVVAAGVHRVQASEEPINPTGAPLFGVLHSFRNEHPEIQCGCIDLDIRKMEEDPEGCALNIFSMLWKSDFEKVVAFRDQGGWVPRLKELKEKPEDLVELQIPMCRYAIVESSSGSYKDIRVTTSNFGTTNADQIEIAVKAVGLNFRDLVGMSGLVDRSEKIGDHDSTIGIEYCGVVTSVPKNINSSFLVGDRIFGVEFNGCMASHIRITNPNLIMRLPARWSFAQGATAPVVYMTAYMALVDIANVKKGDHVLIHTASGGVGLATIQLLKMLGAEIYATAGTKKKRRYLKEIVGLRYVYDSRNHLYLDKIKEATGGKGVDVVLNSITGVGFKEASLACLGVNRGARFIEMSKLNIWTEVEVHEKRSDVKYVVLALEKLVEHTPNSLIPCVKDLEIMFQEGKLDSIPCTSFSVSKVKSAFQYFHESKQIGKIVVKLEEDLFFSNHTYLITGGLGGIGMEVAKWILEKGGSHVALVGRRSPDEVSEAVAAKFKYLSEKSSRRLVFIKGDVSHLNECKDILDIISASHPPLKGIFHSAGVLADGFVLKQSAENFSKVFGPKVQGSWNLHELTKRQDLDYFVLFSSATALFGTPGQSNHSAANSFLDSLAQYRVHELGLKTLSLNWGAWAEVGLAANIVIPGWRKFTPGEGINGLQRAISDTGVHQVAIINIDSNVVEKFPGIKFYLSDFSIKCDKCTKSFVKQNVVGIGQSQKSEENQDKLAEVLNGIEEILLSKCKEAEESLTDKLEILVEFTFRSFSGIPVSDTIDRNQPMRLLGMDSLLEMEIRNKLGKLLKVSIPPGIIHESGTVSGLAGYLSQVLRSPSKPM